MCTLSGLTHWTCLPLVHQQQSFQMVEGVRWFHQSNIFLVSPPVYTVMWYKLLLFYCIDRCNDIDHQWTSLYAVHRVVHEGIPCQMYAITHKAVTIIGLHMCEHLVWAYLPHTSSSRSSQNATHTAVPQAHSYVHGYVKARISTASEHTHTFVCHNYACEKVLLLSIDLGCPCVASSELVATAAAHVYLHVNLS